MNLPVVLADMRTFRVDKPVFQNKVPVKGLGRKN